MRARTVAVAALGAAFLLSCRDVAAPPDASFQQRVAPSSGVKKVAVSPATASVNVGASVQLTATAYGRGNKPVAAAFAWTSSAPAVADVSSSGLVTGKAAGTATITATADGVGGTSIVTVTEPPPPPPADAVVLVGAGDIASCSSTGDEATALLLDGIAGTVFTLGDNAYSSGSATEYANCYDPTWGRQKARTRPAAGNHEYNTANATGYFGYFGAAAGDPTKGYYSYDAGAWHVVVLNSNCAAIGGCAAGSPQEQWLRADLAAHPVACTLAYWHHPRFNSGAAHGNDYEVQPLWQALYDANADLILNGHEHVYERFAPQTPAGVADPMRGIRQLTVGTGGASHYSLGTLQPNSEVFDGSTYGVVKLTLGSTSYSWQFIPVAGQSFTDSGTTSCH
jgi:acid phosphatase type 7